jgi:exonuclease VII small subunit
METLYFTLGVLTVLVILGVVGMFMVWKKAANAAKESCSLWDGIDSLNRDLGCEIEKAFDYANKLHKETGEDLSEIHRRIDSSEMNLNAELNEFQKIMDSRLDKFENRLTKIFEDGCKPVQEK